jgi:hypothetical protein
MKFEHHRPRYYQRDRQKRSSGTADWHCRSPRLRRMHRLIMGSTGVVGGDLAYRIALALEEE